jgi:hypothetical protein
MDGRPLPEDVVALGSERGPRFTIPGWRPSRAAAILAVVTLLAGLAVGYAIGIRQGGPARAATVAPAASSAAPRSAASSADQPDFTLYGPALTEEPGTCSTQVGDDLELGIQVTNTSAETVLLQSAEPVAEVPGLLKVLSWSWAPCGFDGDGIIPDTVELGPGQTTWLTATVKPLVACPGPAPLQFTAAARAMARGDRTRMIAKPVGRLRRPGPFTRDNAGTASPLDSRMTFR